MGLLQQRDFISVISGTDRREEIASHWTDQVKLGLVTHYNVIKINGGIVVLRKSRTRTTNKPWLFMPNV